MEVSQNGGRTYILGYTELSAAVDAPRSLNTVVPAKETYILSDNSNAIEICCGVCCEGTSWHAGCQHSGTVLSI
jgi:hypothetical protein